MGDKIRLTEKKTKTSKFKPSKRTIFFYVLGAFVVGLVFTWWFINIRNASPDITADPNYFSSETALNAEKIAKTGDLESAAVEYDKAIEETEDSYNQSALILAKSSLYYTEGDYTEALSIALGAEDVDENSLVSQHIARIYLEIGDIELSIKYYEKTIELIDRSDMMAVSDIQYFQSIIDNISEGLE